MKKITVWVDTDWGPGGIDWELARMGTAKVYARKGISTWVKATLTIDRSPRKKKPKKINKQDLDK
jgi:hypothetical protein